MRVHIDGLIITGQDHDQLRDNLQRYTRATRVYLTIRDQGGPWQDCGTAIICEPDGLRGSSRTIRIYA